MIECTPAAPSEWTKHYSNVYSQFGEDGLLAEIFSRIGTTNKQCFECGAADGKWFSNSRHLIDSGWSACLIEADGSNWPELDKLDAPPRVTVVHGKAEASGPNSLDSILTMCGFEHAMDLGVIDVDGQDYYLFNGMMKYQPRVMVVEYAAGVADNFIPDLGGKGQASLAAIVSIAISKGYFNAATTRTNLIFVRNDCREKFYAALPTVTPARIVPEIPPMPTPPTMAMEDWQKLDASAVPTIATGVEQEIKIAAILSRPRFGLNIFWDCASEALAPWHIPIQSFYGVFWNMCMERAFETNIAQNVDWILTLDYDTMFSSKHVQMLIDAMGQNPHIDAIAALQCRRGRPLPLCVRADGTMQMTGGPVQMRTAHFGLTLFRVEAFKKMTQKPWMGEVPAADGGWGEGRMDPDIAFWSRWGAAGNTLFVHTGCRIGHVEEMVSEFDASGKVNHSYLSQWRKNNGHQIENFE